MFDDPKKELQELEDQLLAAEENQEPSALDDAEFERLYDEILAEFGPKKSSGEAVPAETEAPIRNFANGYGGVVRTPPLPVGDELLSDDESVPSEKGSKGLIFLAILECAAIAGLAAFWIMNVL